jgi:FkbM family methyltransferase
MTRRFIPPARRFGFSTSVRLHAARLKHRLFSSQRSAASAIRLGSFGTVHLRPATSDWEILHQVIVGDEYDSNSGPLETALRNFYDRVCALGKTPLIVDCGANIGLTSLWYSRRFPRAHVVAVEPQEDNFALLKRNVSGRANITPIMAAVWNRKTQVSLANADGQPWGWRTRQSDAGGLTTVTLPELLTGLDNMIPMIVKIDIEGAEVDLFRSNFEWARTVPLIVFEPHDWMLPWRGTFHAIISALVHSPRDYLFRDQTVFAFTHELAGDQRP